MQGRVRGQHGALLIQPIKPRQQPLRSALLETFNQHTISATYPYPTPEGRMVEIQQPLSPNDQNRLHLRR